MAHKVEICGINTHELPKLNSKQCGELLILAKNGDKIAEEKLMIGNIRLVLSLVQRFNNKGNSDDLFQVGCVGLMKAIKNFDTSLNVRFSTYAVPMIIGEIRRFLRDGSSVKVARSLRDIAYKALQAKEKLSAQKLNAPTLEEIAEEIDVPMKEVACALDAVSEPVSLFEPVFNDGDDAILLMEQIDDVGNNDENWTEKMALSEAIKLLPEKEHNIIQLRYYLGKTQIEISKDLGISQAQVSRLEKNALKRIQKNL